MDYWPHQVCYYTAAEVQDYCVQDPVWQVFRMTMKGCTTNQKLDMLKQYRSCTYTNRRRLQVQVDNYLQALRRGGLLDSNFQVVR